MKLTATVREYGLVHGDPCLITHEIRGGTRRVISQRPLDGDFAIAYDQDENMLLKHGSGKAVNQWAEKTRTTLSAIAPNMCAALTVLTIKRYALTPAVLALINRTLDTTDHVKRLIDDLQKVTSLPPPPHQIPD